MKVKSLLMMLLAVFMLFALGCDLDSLFGNDEDDKKDPTSTTTTVSLSYPANESTEQSTTITFKWSCDANLFDVYLGTSPSNLSKIAGNLTSSSFTKSDLAPGTKYYWKVVVNIGGVTIESPVRSFTTKSSSTTSTLNIASSSSGAIATASSYGSYAGEIRNASKINDGDINTGWAGTSIPAWNKIEFNKEYTITKIKCTAYYHTQTYTLELSTDGINWQNVATHTTPDNKPSGQDEGLDVYEVDINNISAKYVRVTVNKTDAPASHIYQATINEIEVYATNTFFSEDYESCTVGSLPSDYYIRHNGSGDSYQKVIQSGSTKCLQLVSAYYWAVSMTKKIDNDLPSVTKGSVDIKFATNCTNYSYGNTNHVFGKFVELNAFSIKNKANKSFGFCAARLASDGNYYILCDEKKHKVNNDEWITISYEVDFNNNKYEVKVNGNSFCSGNTLFPVTNFSEEWRTTDGSACIYLHVGNSAKLTGLFDNIKITN